MSGLGRAEQALRDLRRVLQTLQRHGDETSVAVALNNRAIVQEKLGRI
jgi:hypothetical protein